MSLMGVKNRSSILIFVFIGLLSLISSCSSDVEPGVSNSSVNEAIEKKDEAIKEGDTKEAIDTQTETTETEVVKTEDITSESLNETAVSQQLPPINFIEGADFVTKFPNEQPKNPVMMEFFSYMCPHCFNFEPTMKRWIAQKPESVELIRIPVSFGQTGSWGITARSYYIAEELNIVDQFSTTIFRKIHIEKKPPRNEKDIQKIFSSLGISDSAFKKASSSFNVDSKLRKAEFLTKKYKVAGVPYFLMNNKYETGENSYESEQTLFRLWNFLPAKDFE